MFTVSQNLLNEVHRLQIEDFLARPVLLPAGTEQVEQTTVVNDWVIFARQRVRKKKAENKNLWQDNKD